MVAQTVTTAFPMLEKEWQSQVIEAARLLGYQHYHSHSSKRSPEGFPDLVLVGRRVVFVELKRDVKASQPTTKQREWLTRLHKAGAEVYLARPSMLQDLASVLASNPWAPGPARARLMTELHHHLIPGQS